MTASRRILIIAGPTYKGLVDKWTVYDNSGYVPVLMEEGRST